MRLLYSAAAPETDYEVSKTNNLRPHTVSTMNVSGAEVRNTIQRMSEGTNNLYQRNQLSAGNTAWVDDGGHNQKVNPEKEIGLKLTGENQLESEVEEFRRKWLAEKCRREVLEGRNGQLLREVRTLRIDK